MKKPEVGRDAQLFEPPPQLRMPDEPMRDVPMRRMTVPVTSGGNTRRSSFGFENDMPISRNEQTSEVPVGALASLSHVEERRLAEESAISVRAGTTGDSPICGSRRRTRTVRIHRVEDLWRMSDQNFEKTQKSLPHWPYSESQTTCRRL
jgi:hypothetical protein